MTLYVRNAMKRIGSNPHCIRQRATMLAFNLCGTFHYKGTWLVKRNHLGIKIKVFKAVSPTEHARVVRSYYPYDMSLGINAPMIDLVLYRPFRFHQFTLVYEGESSFLVSPYYFEGGGTAIDCLPREWVHMNHITREDARIICPNDTNPLITGSEETYG